MKKALAVIDALVTIFIVCPLWYYIVYTLLKAANVDRLVWFLFWIYIPAGIFSRVLTEVIRTMTIGEEKKKWEGMAFGRGTQGARKTSPNLPDSSDVRWL